MENYDNKTKIKFFEYAYNFNMEICNGNTVFIVTDKEGKLIANSTPFEWGINEICLYDKDNKILRLKPQDIFNNKYGVSVINFKNNKVLIKNNKNMTLVVKSVNLKIKNVLNNVSSVAVINTINNYSNTYLIGEIRQDGFTIVGPNNRQYFIRYDIVEKGIRLKFNNKKRKLNLVLFKEKDTLVQYQERIQ